MTNQEVEKWLLKESSQKNKLAESYLSLLKNATPEMKDKWYQQLGTMLEGIKAIELQVLEERKRSH